MPWPGCSVLALATIMCTPWPGCSVLALATIMCTPVAHVVFALEVVFVPEVAFEALMRAPILLLPKKGLAEADESASPRLRIIENFMIRVRFRN
jgi:hypothetical protein